MAIPVHYCDDEPPVTSRRRLPQPSNTGPSMRETDALVVPSMSRHVRRSICLWRIHWSVRWLPWVVTCASPYAEIRDDRHPSSCNPLTSPETVSTPTRLSIADSHRSMDAAVMGSAKEERQSSTSGSTTDWRQSSGDPPQLAAVVATCSRGTPTRKLKNLREGSRVREGVCAGRDGVTNHKRSAATTARRPQETITLSLVDAPPS